MLSGTEKDSSENKVFACRREVEALPRRVWVLIKKKNPACSLSNTAATEAEAFRILSEEVTNNPKQNGMGPQQKV
jgi:hypothetical protein